MSYLLNKAIKILFLIILIIVLFVVIKISKTIKKEKRITRFSTKSLTTKTTSFAEKVSLEIEKLLEKVSKLTNKLLLNKILKRIYKESFKYSEEKELDIFISKKIIAGILGILIVILSDILRLRDIRIIQLLFGGFIGFIIPDVLMLIHHKTTEKDMENDLLKAIIIMNNAFKSGRSIMQGNELNTPNCKEFKKMFIDLTYWLELETVFDRFYKRVNVEEIKYMTSTLVIINKTGGNIVKIFSSIEQEFYERRRLKQELESQTSLSKLIFIILIIMPIVVFLSIFILNKDYFNIFLTNNIGKILLLIILSLYLLYIIIIRKITNMKVW